MEAVFHSNQELYDYLDETIVQMNADDLATEAQRIHVLLHVAVWTTATELFDELGKVLLELIASPTIPDAIRARLRRCADAVDAAPPETRRRWRGE